MFSNLVPGGLFRLAMLDQRFATISTFTSNNVGCRIQLCSIVWPGLYFPTQSYDNYRKKKSSPKVILRTWVLRQPFFRKNLYKPDFVTRNSNRTETNTTNTNPTQDLARQLSLQRLYPTSKEALKPLHGSYNPTTFLSLSSPSLFYDNILRTLMTKTNQKTDKQQFTRSNAATARPLISMTPAENLNARHT